MIINKYLYEIVEDYKNANSEEEKTEIFKDFCSSIWGNKNKRRTYNRPIRFKVRNDLLDSDVGRIFNAWSELDCVNYKSTTKDTDWRSLIRQKINNLYTRYCDEEVILKKDYIELLNVPKKLYYRWIDGEEIKVQELTTIINDAINKASELKYKYQKEKMHLSWNEYKGITESFLKKIIDRCKLIEDYEIKNLTNAQICRTNKYIYDFFNEDKSYIKYICDSLEGEMLNYQKNYYGLKRGRDKQFDRCQECGALIEKTNNRVKYCKDCAIKINREKTKNNMKNIRKRNV